MNLEQYTTTFGDILQIKSQFCSNFVLLLMQYTNALCYIVMMISQSVDLNLKKCNLEKFNYLLTPMTYCAIFPFLGYFVMITTNV